MLYFPPDMESTEQTHNIQHTEKYKHRDILYLYTSTKWLSFQMWKPEVLYTHMAQAILHVAWRFVCNHRNASVPPRLELLVASKVFLPSQVYFVKLQLGQWHVRHLYPFAIFILPNYNLDSGM